jgi:hypothetical protein
MPPNEAEFLAALRQVAVAFDSLGIEHALGGSFASSVHGEARATRDADLIAAVAGKHAEPLARMLLGEFYVDAAQIAAAALILTICPPACARITGNSARISLNGPKKFVSTFRRI